VIYGGDEANLLGLARPRVICPKISCRVEPLSHPDTAEISRYEAAASVMALSPERSQERRHGLGCGHRGAADDLNRLFHGSPADSSQIGDFLVCPADGDPLEDLYIPLGQRSRFT
jgi:hypothetical protein